MKYCNGWCCNNTLIESTTDGQWWNNKSDWQNWNNIWKGSTKQYSDRQYWNNTQAGSTEKNTVKGSTETICTKRISGGNCGVSLPAGAQVRVPPELHRWALQWSFRAAEDTRGSRGLAMRQAARSASRGLITFLIIRPGLISQGIRSRARGLEHEARSLSFIINEISCRQIWKWGFT